MKSWLAQTLLPGTTFLHINGVLDSLQLFYMIAVWESDMSDTFFIPRLNCPMEPAFLNLGQVIPETSPAITKASFQVISVWLGQRTFPFKIS